MCTIFIIMTIFFWFYSRFLNKSKKKIRRKLPDLCVPNSNHATKKKAAWVFYAVMKIKERHPDFGCRKIAHMFNQIYYVKTGISVGKTWVSEAIKKHNYKRIKINHAFKHSIPPMIQNNHKWGIDTTILKDKNKNHHILFGSIDHGSRIITALDMIKSFNAWTALGYLFIAIGSFGKPNIIRTDNHPVFHSKLWKCIIKIAGIKIEYTQPFSPWQNGKIERLFGTLKNRLAYYKIINDQHLKKVIPDLKKWYNYLRPHQHLYGLTPMQVWHNINPYQKKPYHLVRHSNIETTARYYQRK